MFTFLLNFFLLLKIVSLTNLQEIILPKKTLTFCKDVDDSMQYAELLISKASRTDGLFYRIISPDGSSHINHKRRPTDFNDSNEMTYSEEYSDLEYNEKPLERDVRIKFESKGIWTVQVYNRSDELEKFSISIHSVLKSNKGNEDVIALRNALNQVQGAVETLGNENHFAQNIQQKNIEDASRLSRYLNWLIFSPIGTFLVVYAEGVFARQLVRPKGKRFKGLF